MPAPIKQCEGRLSESTKLLLRANRDRAAWGMHPCDVCGQMVGVLAVNCDWVPEKHWPSVTYGLRKSGTARYSRVSSHSE